MAFHTKKDFADLCYIPTNALSVYIKRGKVIVKNDLISDSIQENADFLKKMRAKGPSSAFISNQASEKNAETPAEKPEKSRKKAPKQEPQEADLPENSDQNPQSTPDNLKYLNVYQLDREIKLRDIAKKEVDTRIARLKEERMLGANIPTDLVKGVVSNLTKTFVSSFKDGADYLIIEITKSKSLSAVESAQIKGKLIDIINTATSKAVADARKNLSMIINDVSIKREVGEHD